MRKRWKEVDLGMLTMLAALLAVAATFLVAYLAGARWIERRSSNELASAAETRDPLFAGQGKRVGCWSA
jgi:hypothetical protein